MNATSIEEAESEILTRIIAPDAPTMTRDVALEFLKLAFPDSDKQRMAELAAKARQGSLTPEEQLQAEGYERVSSFLGLLKSKARRSLQAASE